METRRRFKVAVCPQGEAISSHFKHAFAGENVKLSFAPYAAEHDEVNAVGTWISKKLFKWASVLNDGKRASLNVGRDPINHLRQICRRPDFMTPRLSDSEQAQLEAPRAHRAASIAAVLTV